jgi:RNA polymerase subunit RPABC4/transcription elongation factor Spt4
VNPGILNGGTFSISSLNMNSTGWVTSKFVVPLAGVTETSEGWASRLVVVDSRHNIAIRDGLGASMRVRDFHM